MIKRMKHPERDGISQIAITFHSFRPEMQIFDGKECSSADYTLNR